MSAEDRVRERALWRGRRLLRAVGVSEADEDLCLLAWRVWNEIDLFRDLGPHEAVVRVVRQYGPVTPEIELTLGQVADLVRERSS